MANEFPNGLDTSDPTLQPPEPLRDWKVTPWGYGPEAAPASPDLIERLKRGSEQDHHLVVPANLSGTMAPGLLRHEPMDAPEWSAPDADKLPSVGDAWKDGFALIIVIALLLFAAGLYFVMHNWR